MSDPRWLEGDAFALGDVDDCPVCLELTLWYGSCENPDCGFNSNDPDPDVVYDHWKEREL